MKVEKSYLKEPIRPIQQKRNNSENMIQFSDNRKYPISYQLIKEKKLEKTSHSSLHKGAGAIQLMEPEELHDLFRKIVHRDKESFKARFRSIAPGMDEEISCKTTFAHAQEMLKKKKPKSDIEDFLKLSDKIRLPTSITAHHVLVASGAKARMAHPTSAGTSMYGTEQTAAGHDRWVGHTSFDRGRASVVESASSENEMVHFAIAYSLGAGVQPRLPQILSQNYH